MRKLLWVITLVLFAVPAYGASCGDLLAGLKLPVKLKSRGNPSALRWDRVEKTLTALREGLQGHACEFTFEQVFIPKKDGILFPLIGNLLRTAPEESLKGVEVFNGEGEALGRFENRVTFEKKGEYTYTHYYFQFMDHSGDLQSSGNRLLIDIDTGRPLFLVKWDEIKDRTVISTMDYSQSGAR